MLTTPIRQVTQDWRCGNLLRLLAALTMLLSLGWVTKVGRLNLSSDVLKAGLSDLTPTLAAERAEGRQALMDSRRNRDSGPPEWQGG